MSCFCAYLPADTEYWLNWTCIFGSISGHDAKIDYPEERYLTTAFCYGCNLGPTQTVRYVRSEDTLMVWPLDRLGRTMHHLIQVVGRLRPGHWRQPLFHQ